MTETKICTKCHQEKPIEEFSFKNKEKNIRKSQCKKCVSEYQKKRYHENKNKLDEYKKTLHCVKCNENRYYVLDFHHLDASSKVNTVTRLSTHSSNKAMWDEIEKCIVLCSNCHREFHHLQKENPNLTIQEYCGLV